VWLFIGLAVDQQASSILQTPPRYSQKISRVGCSLILRPASSAFHFYKARWSHSITTAASHQVVRQQCFHFVCHQFLKSSMIRTSCWPILLDYSISSNLPTITVTRVASLTKQSSESDAAVMSPSGHAIEDFNGLNPISLTRLVAKEPLLRLHQRLQLRVWQQRRCYLLSPSHPCAPWEVYNSLKISSTDANGNACWESQDRRICTFLFLRTRREPHYFYEMSLEVIKPFTALHICSFSRHILQIRI